MFDDYFSVRAIMPWDNADPITKHGTHRIENWCEGRKQELNCCLNCTLPVSYCEGSPECWLLKSMRKNRRK